MRRMVAVTMMSMLALAGVWGEAQLRAGAVITMTARLPGSVTLEQQRVPITIVVQGGKPVSSRVPVVVAWNLDPQETQAFRVIATFRSVQLQTPSVAARVDGGEFRRFSEKTGRMVLLNVPVGKANRQGAAEHVVELKLEDGAFADGVYDAVLELQADW